MMNLADPILCLLTGIAVPMALAGFVAEGAGVLSARGESSWFGWALGAWGAAMVAGPGLFAQRLVEGWRSGAENTAEQLCGWVACAGWAALYGYVLLSAVRLSFGLV
jgi:hypothetical protein